MASENRYSYSHKQDILSDSLRGLAVGIRGVLEAKRMAREAKSGRERRIADHYVRLKRLDLQERRLAISEGAAAMEMEQAEQEHKDEWHKRLAATHDRLESLYRERNRAAAPKERERIDNEIAMEARAVVRLGKNLGYSYPHIEQRLKEREDAAIEFEEKSGRIDALDISDEGKAALHTALENEFFGIGTREETKIDEILGQLEAIEALDETPEMNREKNSLLQDLYLNEEFGVAASGAEEAARKEEVLQVLEENKGAFSEQEYAGIKEQIELGKITDSGDFIKLLAKMGSGSTEEIINIYRDIPNRTVLNSIGNHAITSKDEAQWFLRSVDRWLDGRPFEAVDETSKKRVARLFINEVMENVDGGDIVKGHLRAYKILQNRLPALLMDAERLAANGKSVGRLTQVEEGRWRWESESSDPEVTALRTKLTDVLNGYMALRKEAVSSQPSAKRGTKHPSLTFSLPIADSRLLTAILAEIGSGYEANKAAIEGLATHVLDDLSVIYKGVMGPEWGEYAATVDFQQDTEPADVWISEVLKDYGLTDKTEIIVPSGADSAIEPSEIVDLLAGDAEAIRQAKSLTPESYVKSVESQLRKRYPGLPDEEIGSLMDEFREKADFSGLGNPTPTEEETESENAAFDRAPKETDFKHRGADGVEYNLHAEVAYMIAIDGWSRGEIKAQLRKDYPELSDEQIEAVLNDPEFEYLGDDR